MILGQLWTAEARGDMSGPWTEEESTYMHEPWTEEKLIFLMILGQPWTVEASSDMSGPRTEEGRRNMHISCNLQKGEKPREPNELLLRLLCTNVHDRSINAILSVPFTN